MSTSIRFALVTSIALLGCWPQFPISDGYGHDAAMEATITDCDYLDATMEETFHNPCGTDSGLTWCTMTSATTGQCVDTTIDDINCGGCGITCVNGHCTNSQCVCPTGETACLDFPFERCVDLSSSPLSCGICNNNCGAFACNQGQCTGCEGGWTLCTGGLCVPSTFSWPTACGGCGVVCDSGTCVVDNTGHGIMCGM